jgi:hypothetical protein
MTNAKKIIMVLDTETCDLSGPVYDVGFTIADKKGEIVYRYNALVEEIFTNPDAMTGAYFAKKVFSHYAGMLSAGDIKLVPYQQIVAHMREVCAEYGVNVMAAYNLAFDRRVMAVTNDLLGDGKKVLPFAMDSLDIWRFACETQLSSATYRKLAEAQGWVSNAGNLRTGAEYAYRFCRGDWGFIEQHTALSDAEIETSILASCYASKKRVPYNIIDGIPPWMIVNPKGDKNDRDIHGSGSAAK